MTSSIPTAPSGHPNTEAPNTEAMQALACSIASDVADRNTRIRAAWYRGMLALCQKAIRDTKGRRAWIIVEVKGHRTDRSIEVYPGVRGWRTGHGRRASLNLVGGLNDQPYTTVKVCARTMLEAVQRGVRTLPPEVQELLQAKP